jgi:LPS sulfotransferase NodH
VPNGADTRRTGEPWANSSVPGAVLVCTTPRSGSWLLSDLLERTQKIGMAQEYFHVNYVAAVAQQHGLASRAITGEYLGEITRRTQSEGRIFSSKLHWLQINQLVDALRLVHPDLAAAQKTAPELIDASWPGTRYLYLTRRDKARQAISLFRALRSDVWWERADEPGAAVPTEGEPEPIPDYLAIRWLEDDLAWQEAEWRRYFEVFGLEAFKVVYEELCAEPGRIVGAALEWLGVETTATLDGPSRLRRQAGAETETAYAEYMQIRDSLPACPPGWTWSFERRAFVPPVVPVTRRLSPFQ